MCSFVIAAGAMSGVVTSAVAGGLEALVSSAPAVFSFYIYLSLPFSVLVSTPLPWSFFLSPVVPASSVTDDPVPV